MPRPKGSKNRKQNASAAGTGETDQLTRLEETLRTAETDIERLTAALNRQKAELLLKRKQQKALLKELTARREKLNAAVQQKADAERRAEAERLLDKLLSSGKSAEEIMQLIVSS